MTSEPNVAAMYHWGKRGLTVPLFFCGALYPVNGATWWMDRDRFLNAPNSWGEPCPLCAVLAALDLEDNAPLG